ncbi:MAG: M6 family metalloprotease domain-containing protein [Armatimonadetes bacterium]|nr:MAG: M6 family metalloprotease domain-containing protein [Armatimonadota bacterium]
MSRRFLTLLAVLGLAISVLLPVTATAAAPGPDDVGQQKPDDLSHPLGDQQRANREIAAEAQLIGKASGGSVHRVAHGQYVELERQGEDTILTVLGEFSDHAHNTMIPEPDRSIDNTTHWVDDFSREHYENMLFSEAPGEVSMRNFYIELSSNRYTVNGTVSDWITAPDVAVSYDDDLPAPQGVWRFVQDTVDGWYAELQATMTPDEIDAYLAQFDVWDRYDYNGNGNFDEPDGYVDHFQSVHAGEGEEAGGGILGGQAIWSHRWYAFFNLIGTAGPTGNLAGGLEIGDSGLWIGDYTIEPENGGVGVFAHEFAHDLGLPDLYSTAGGENSTGFWTLMSSGSWLGDGTVDIGTRPGHMGAWEKFQLGWLNYEVAFAGEKSTHKLGPASANTKKAQTVFVVLPDKEVTQKIADPYAGDYFYYSGSGNNLDNFMTKTVNLAAGSSLSAKANVQIEVDWDYAYVVVSTDGGASWDHIATSLSTNSDPNGQNFGNGITGNSGGWVDLTADLSAYTGDVILGFRYWTDVAAVEPGFMLDEIQITGYPSDGAEADAGWTVDGFSVTTGTETASFFNAYVAENRNYQGYDDGLRVGPYNFGYPAPLNNWVDHFPYQDGLLISYWDTSYSDNNTPTHPGGGLILPIDAHPDALLMPGGAPWRNRVQSYDSTFGKSKTDKVTLHVNGVATTFGGLAGVRTFDDRNSYWDPANPWGSVIVPNTGTQIIVKSTSAHGAMMQIQVRPAK